MALILPTTALGSKDTWHTCPVPTRPAGLCTVCPFLSQATLMRQWEQLPCAGTAPVTMGCVALGRFLSLSGPQLPPL